jgi:hypothetical protein
MCADDEGDFVENNFNSVKDVPMMHVNFNVTVLTFPQKKYRKYYLGTSPPSWAT